jgi:large subunit ribosomal protein L10
MKLEQKQQIVENLHDRFERSKLVIVCDYKGLNVKQVSDLRRKLKEADIEFRVVKNSLLVRASRETDVDLIADHFKGPSAVAISYQDPVAPAKVLTRFAEDNQLLEIRSGVMQGRVLDPKDVKALSDLPSREVLLGKMLSAMNGVPTGLVRLLNEMPRRLLTVLEALKEKKAAA